MPGYFPLNLWRQPLIFKAPKIFWLSSLVSKFGIGKRMPVIVSSLLPISRGDSYIDSFSAFLCSIGEMHAWYTTFLELQRPRKGHSSLFLQLQDVTSGLLSFAISSFSSLLIWLLKMLFIFLVQEKLIFTVFLSKILLNGLSLLKCLSRSCRKYLPILMLVSLQNGRLNQTTFLFLFFPRLFAWLLLLIISPTLMSVRIPRLLLLTLEVKFHRG